MYLRNLIMAFTVVDQKFELQENQKNCRRKTNNSRHASHKTPTYANLEFAATYNPLPRAIQTDSKSPCTRTLSEYLAQRRCSYSPSQCNLYETLLETT